MCATQIQILTVPSTHPTWYSAMTILCINACRKIALERQYLFRTYLAHHELESILFGKIITQAPGSW